MNSSIVIMIIVLLFSMVFHEVAHGLTAYRLGDPTAKMEGRLTLNPLMHVDPMMTFIVPIICYLSFGFAFGGAKPVPVNPYNFRNPKKGMAITAAAGPLSNLLLIIVTILIYKLLVLAGVLEPLYHFGRINSGDLNFLEYLVFYSIIVNSVLMVFNLIPIPPLDGSRVLVGVLPDDLAIKYQQVEKYGFFIIIGIILLGDVVGFSLIGALVSPVLQFMLRITFIA